MATPLSAVVATPPPAVTSSNSFSDVQEAVNLNPEAQDCYFYFYSSCSKVYIVDSTVDPRLSKPHLCEPLIIITIFTRLEGGGGASIY